MNNVNKHLMANIRGLVNPIVFDPDYLASGMVQQLINYLSLEATQPATQHRLFLDEMSPACRDSLFLILSELRDAIALELPGLVQNPGNPFANDDGWALAGTESGDTALSESSGNLVATITAGSESDLSAYATVTTVVGKRYTVNATGIAILADASLRAANATTLATALSEVELEAADSPHNFASFSFEATATTTYVGFRFADTPANGDVLSLGGLRVDVEVPMP